MNLNEVYIKFHVSAATIEARVGVVDVYCSESLLQ